MSVAVAKPTLHEQMKASFSNLGVIAANYLPKGFKQAMLDMAYQADQNSEALAELKTRMSVIDALVNTNQA